MNNNIKWLFFDIGGTLFDETAAFDDLLQTVTYKLNAAGISVTLDEVRSQYIMSFAGGVRGTISGLLEQYGLPREWLPYNSELDTPYPEAYEVIAELTARYKLGIIANQELGTEKRLDKFGLLKYFDIVVASAEVGVSKPDPQIFQIAIERSGTAPGEIVMIGDRLDNDVYPAKMLGMRTIRVKQGYNSYQTPQSDEQTADVTVNGLRELLGIL